jgi:hypothetical protein
MSFDLALHVVQARHDLAGEAGALGGRQGRALELAGIKHGSRERRADLVGQRGHHLAHGGQTLMAAQVLLQTAGFRLVGQQNDLPGFILQGTGGQADAAAVLQGDFMAIVQARRKALLDDVAPELAFQRLAQQLDGRRVAMAHLPLAVEHHHAARQQLQQVFQAAGDAFLLGDFLQTLVIGHLDFAGQLGHPVLQQQVGVVEVGGKLVEGAECQVERFGTAQLERLLQPARGRRTFLAGLPRVSEGVGCCAHAVPLSCGGVAFSRHRAHGTAISVPAGSNQ